MGGPVQTGGPPPRRERSIPDSRFLAQRGGPPSRREAPVQAESLQSRWEDPQPIREAQPSQEAHSRRDGPAQTEDPAQTGSPSPNGRPPALTGGSLPRRNPDWRPFHLDGRPQPRREVSVQTGGSQSRLEFLPSRREVLSPERRPQPKREALRPYERPTYQTGGRGHDGRTQPRREAPRPDRRPQLRHVALLPDSRPDRMALGT